MKPAKFTVSVAAVFLLGACAHAPAPGSFKSAPELLTAEGVCALNSRDLAASRACAVLDAERSAVSRVAALYLNDEARVEKSSVLENSLLKTPQPYVARYEIMSEGQDGSYYRVRMKTWIYQGRIASELRTLNLSGPAAAGPRAAFVQRGAAAPAFASAFKEAFLKRSAVIIEEFPFAADPAVAAGGEAALLQAASASGADLLLAASAAASASGAGINTGFYPSKAEAFVKVYDAASGKLLLDLSSQANGMDSTEAGSFSKALSAAGELLAQETAARAERLVKPDAAITLKFYGVESLESLEKLKAQLLKLDAKSMRLDSYASGTALFQVVPLRPDPQELASSVLRGDSLGLELEGTGAQEVAFSLRVKSREVFLQN
ncbi:MAG: hypothetical protein A2X35_12360 [Elusimicrobia bacterium GWA2_61_42]|nr:MAG: hypothetical protein A2X35_12360 [Elusimicrobia bacterium GWA2_61_42]OGR75290.1 MAG: hypothetical protein A2X38_05805 [Elusimicrobia bacterium GWC2_61_25]